MKSLHSFLIFSALLMYFPVSGFAVTLEIFMCTGNGELRGGNSAWIGLVDSRGRLLESKLLSTKHRPGQCQTTRFDFRTAVFSKIRIIHDGKQRSGHPFEGYNNWQLRTLSVKELIPPSGYCVIYDSSRDRSFRGVRFSEQITKIDFQKFPSRCPDGWNMLSGDFNGDGNWDQLCHNPRNGAKSVLIKEGSCYIPAWDDPSNRWCSHRDAELYVSDVNGDGKDDLICKDPGRIWFDYVDTNFFQGTDSYVDTVFCTHQGSKLLIGDVNGDNRADFVCHDPGRIWIDYGPASGHHDFFLDTTWCNRPGAASLYDHNRDGRLDLSCSDGQNTFYDYADRTGRFDGQTDHSHPVVILH